MSINKTWPISNCRSDSDSVGISQSGQEIIRLYGLSSPKISLIGLDLILNKSEGADAGRLWYADPNVIEFAINYAKFSSRSHDAVIRVYDEAGNVIETHEDIGDFKKTLG